MKTESSEHRELLATLVVHRSSPRDCNLRTIHVLVDEQRTATLYPGNVLEIELAPGLHTITVDNTWTSKTITLAFEPRSIVHIETGNLANALANAMMMLLGTSPLGIFLEQEHD